MKFMWQLIWLEATHSFVIRNIHIPGITYPISDSLSRFQFQKFRELAPKALDDLLSNYTCRDTLPLYTSGFIKPSPVSG